MKIFFHFFPFYRKLTLHNIVMCCLKLVYNKNWVVTSLKFTIFGRNAYFRNRIDFSSAYFWVVLIFGMVRYMTIVQLEKGAKLERLDSSQDKRQRDHKKLVRFSKDSIDTTRKISKLKRVFNISSKRQILSIFAINITGDVMELYAMHRESGIYKYCLIEEAPIPLHMTSPSAIYPLIYSLMTLRMAVACTIYKILHNSDSRDSEHSSGEMAITVSTPKIHRIEINPIYVIL